MQIPSRRTEDLGATSEDDGLPCSPPEMSFHEQVMHEAVYKVKNIKLKQYIFDTLFFPVSIVLYIFKLSVTSYTVSKV